MILRSIHQFFIGKPVGERRTGARFFELSLGQRRVIDLAHGRSGLTHWLKRNSKINKSYAHRLEIIDSKKGILHYKKIKNLNRYCVLEITLETGRHHQIRSQLGFIGYPIKGDLKYNAKRSNPDSSIDLHARSLTICHPTTKKIITILAKPPIKPQWNFALSDLLF